MGGGGSVSSMPELGHYHLKLSNRRWYSILVPIVAGYFEVLRYLHVFVPYVTLKWKPLAEILLFTIAGCTRVGPLNQWVFGEPTHPMLNYIASRVNPFE